MLAIGVGGADAVDAMTGTPWELKAPQVVGSFFFFMVVLRHVNLLDRHTRYGKTQRLGYAKGFNPPPCWKAYG
jgi:hypothetical protein